MITLRRPKEITVYIGKDAEEFRRVETRLSALELRYRVWTTAEYPVFGHSPWDPRLWGRGEKKLRKVWHIDVEERDRSNLIAVNNAVRAVTGKTFNARPLNEIN